MADPKDYDSSAAPDVEVMKDIACDECGSERANFIHIIPTLTQRRAVLFSCPSHDWGGYSFPLPRWWYGPQEDWHHPGEPYTFRAHLWSKTDGPRLIELVDGALLQKSGIGYSSDFDCGEVKITIPRITLVRAVRKAQRVFDPEGPNPLECNREPDCWAEVEALYPYLK